MKSFVCVVLLAAVALAAPEGKRDKRGFLLGHGHGFGHYDSHSLLDSYDHGISYGGYGYDSHYDHAPIFHAPATKIISVNKVVEVPKVVEVKKIVSVPKVVSVPHVVKVHKYIEEPHISHVSYGSYGSGWW